MAVDTYPIGRKAAAYWNTAGEMIGDSDGQGGTLDAAAWLALATTKVWSDQFDVNYATTPEYADITTRKAAAGGFSAQKPVLLSGDVTFECAWDTNSADPGALQHLIDSSINGTPVALAFLDYPKGANSGVVGAKVQGLVGNFFPSFTKSEPIRDIQKAQFSVVSAGDLEWYVSTGSA